MKSKKDERPADRKYAFPTEAMKREEEQMIKKMTANNKKDGKPQNGQNKK